MVEGLRGPQPIRRPSTFNTAWIDHFYAIPYELGAQLFLYGDVTHGYRLVTLLNEVRPDEVYRLAAQSHVRVSFDEPEFTEVRPLRRPIPAADRSRRR